MGGEGRTIQEYPKKSITVLIAIYKGAKHIKAKIKNIQQQTMLDDTHIVFLNCQNIDNERSQYEHILNGINIHEIYYKDYVRIYKSWNDGINLTQSDYICNSNIDDMWHPEYLEICRNFLNNNPKYACVSSGVLVTSIPNQYDHKKWNAISRLPQRVYPNTTAGPCPVWRRSLHRKYGMFGDYRTIGDAKMWEAWYKGGEIFGYIDIDLALYYISPTSLERRRDKSGVLLKQLDLDDDMKEKNIE